MDIEKLAKELGLDIDPEILANPVFQALAAEGLAIQDRFVAEPVYAKTGKGYLKSVGVSEIEYVKKAMKVATLPHVC